MSGMVGMLTDETTGSAIDDQDTSSTRKKQRRTGVIATDSSLHDGLHPVADDRLLLGAEVVRLVVVMNDLEAIPAGINVLIRNNFVANEMDVCLELRLLWEVHIFSIGSHRVCTEVLTDLSSLFNMYR